MLLTRTLPGVPFWNNDTGELLISSLQCISHVVMQVKSKETESMANIIDTPIFLSWHSKFSVHKHMEVSWDWGRGLICEELRRIGKQPITKSTSVTELSNKNGNWIKSLGYSSKNVWEQSWFSWRYRLNPRGRDRLGFRILFSDVPLHQLQADPAQHSCYRRSRAIF